MKILIIGSVGSGKTTFAKKISKKYNIKYYEIDSIVHNDNNSGKKRTKEEQYNIIMNINKNQDWIIEGTLRSHLYYLLELADKIVLLDIPTYKRMIRIIKRYLKQKLRIEKCNYISNLHMLKLMLKWCSEYDEKREELDYILQLYRNKIEVIKK